MPINLELLKQRFSIAKLKSLPAGYLHMPFVFVAKTNTELSLVCETESMPGTTLEREDGWRCMRIVGQLDFGLVGIIAGISSLLAGAGIPIFVVSTFDTDYILLKEELLKNAVQILSEVE